MSAWDTYESRIKSHGDTKRDVMLKRTKHMHSSKMLDNLSYHTVLLDNDELNVAIVNSDNLNEKMIYVQNSGVIKCGDVVSWMNNQWLITEYDANTEVYVRAKMQQCNYLLKWIDDTGKICEHWCIIQDGTKYLTGEYEDRNFVVTRGDTRITMTISKNSDTTKLNRSNRFLIDDPDIDSREKLSYELTKPLKVGHVYDTGGVFSFVLQETASTEYDNHELGIADYYKFFPREASNDISSNRPSVISPDNSTDNNGRKVWL